MPQVHGSVRKKRAQRLCDLGEKAAQRHFDALIGRTVEVLVEQEGVGCTPQFAKIKLADYAPAGELVMAECVARESNTVVARIK
jgi:threonylcarbamoyladenosine tRNA methylthiotransferase MtaB